jgi:hypothetical protein
MMQFITGQSNDRVPLVWNYGFSIGCEVVSSPIEIARIVRSFIKTWWAEYQRFCLVTTLSVAFWSRAPSDETPGRDAQQ